MTGATLQADFVSRGGQTRGSKPEILRNEKKIFTPSKRQNRVSPMAKKEKKNVKSSTNGTKVLATEPAGKGNPKGLGAS